MADREDQGSAMQRRPQGGLSRSGLYGAPMRGNIWAEMEEMQRRMDAMFQQIFGGWGGSSMSSANMGGRDTWRTHEDGTEPDADIFESDSEFTVHAALPGVNPQDISVEATEDTISLTAQRRSQSPGMQGNTEGQPETSQTMQSQPHTQHRQSRFSSQSRFSFRYSLPVPINPDAVTATFRNGILEMHLPKAQPKMNQAKSVRIESEGGEISSGRIGAGSMDTASQSATSPQEGAPNQKMGAAYTPNASEDHTAQANMAGNRMETNTPQHQPRTDAYNMTGGSTNPMAPNSEAETAGTRSNA